MKSKASRFSWCEKACRGIVLPSERRKAQKELEGHMEDKIDDFMSMGMDFGQALTAAERAMGDPVQTAEMFSRVYPRFASWVFIFARSLFMSTAVFFFVYFFSLGYCERYDLFSSLAENPEEMIEIGGHNGFERAGYRFSAERAAVTDDGTLILEIKVSGPIWFASPDRAAEMLKFRSAGGQKLESRFEGKTRSLFCPRYCFAIDIKEESLPVEISYDFGQASESFKAGE